MATSRSSDSCTRIVFEGSDFSLYRHHSPAMLTDWLEFYLVYETGGFYLGGEDGLHLHKQIERLESFIPSVVNGEPFSETLAGYSESGNYKYIGYFVFSGYNTLNILKNSSDVYFIVFADASMKVFASAQIIETDFRSLKYGLTADYNIFSKSTKSVASFTATASELL